MEDAPTRRWWITRIEWTVGLVATALTLAIGLWSIDELSRPMFGADTFDSGWARLLVLVIPMIAAVVGLVWMTRIVWPADKQARDWRYRAR
jgi:hypothetical protein